MNENIEEDRQKAKTSVGLVILSFLFPIVGIIIFFVKKKESKNPAKNYLIAALIGWLLNIIISLPT